MLFNLNGSKVIDDLQNVGDFFTHNIVDHPLLSTDEIRKLVKRMPKGRVLYSAGVKPESAMIGDWHNYPSRYHVHEAIDRMEEADAYLFIIAPETDAGFRPLYLQLKVDLDEFCRRNGYQLTEYKLVLFVSSPHAISPHHIDHQHTFIAQIRGTKTIYQWPAGHMGITTPEELEIFFARVTRKLAMKEEYEHLRTPYQLTPGNGCYIPFAAPHTVTNGDEVNVSLSIIFNTKETQKIENIYRANHFLRHRFHLNPSLPGESTWKDQMKNQYLRTHDWSLKVAALPGKAVRKAKRILLEKQHGPLVPGH